MNERWKNTIKKKINKDEPDQQVSKEELYNILSTRIKTTMVGALATIERELAHLWEDEEDKEVATYFRNKFLTIRQKILFDGNKQLDFLKNDLKQFNISRKFYFHLPYKERKNDGKQEGNNQ